MKIDCLDWDTNFFGLKTGKIICTENLEERELGTLLNQAKKEEYSLVYVFTPKDVFLTDDFITSYKAILIDRKLVYCLIVADAITDEFEGVVEYEEESVSEKLLQLTYVSGQHSRFLLDKKMPRGAFHRLYQEWIKKSVSGVLADKIFVMKEEGEIVGFVTLKIKNSTNAEIGLIAVAEEMQGKRVGTKLINKCVDFLQQQGVGKLFVPTQFENIQACNFYEKNNFNKYLLMNIYHFWL